MLCPIMVCLSLQFWKNKFSKSWFYFGWRLAQNHLADRSLLYSSGYWDHLRNAGSDRPISAITGRKMDELKPAFILETPSTSAALLQLDYSSAVRWHQHSYGRRSLFVWA